MDWIKTILFFVFITTVYAQQFFNTMPPPVNTNFTCKGRDTGFYADVETNCRVYHTCDDHGNKFTYYCPAETAFRQEALVCDHAHLVDCSRGRRISELKSSDETNEKKIERKVGNYERTVTSRTTFSKDDSSLREDNDNVSGDNYKSFQPGNSNSAYTRSFKITPEPISQIPSQKSFNSRLPTFVLSSSVFLRNRSNSKNDPAQSQVDQTVTNTSKDSDKRGEYFGSSSSTSSTTFRPFGGGFKAEHHFPNREDFRTTTVDKQRESMNEFSRKFSSTTPTSVSTTLGLNYRGKGSSTDFPNFEVKFNEENNRGNERSSASRIQLDNAKINGRKTSVAFQFDDKRKNDKKIELTNNFRGHTGNSEKVEDHSSGGRNVGFGKTAESVLKDSSFTKSSAGFDKNGNEQVKVLENMGPSFFFDSGNFPYSETLRSMQAGNNKSLQQYSSTTKVSSVPPSTTSAPTTKVGTEFPIHALVGALSPLEPNEFDDDPYYPKRSTTPEIYYKLSDLDREGKHSLRFSTKRPWLGSVDFEIPEVLPDFNTLEDLVDRRKLFYIPRVKAT